MTKTKLPMLKSGRKRSASHSQSNNAIKGRGQSIVIGMMVLFTIVVVMMSALLVQRRAQQSRAVDTTNQYQAQGDFTFTEDFSTVALKDAEHTTGEWDTTLKQAGLTKQSGSWYKANNTSLGYDNVSNQPTRLSLTFFGTNLILSEDNRPYIAFEEQTSPGGGNQIYFSYWNGSTWKGLAGGARDNISNGSGVDSQPCIGMGSDQKPVIAWSRVTGTPTGLLASRWTGSIWTSPQVISTSAPWFHCDMAVKSNNVPAVVWVDFAGGADQLYSEFSGGSWSTPEKMATAGCFAFNPSVAFDSDDVAHTAYVNSDTCSSSYLYYGKRSAPGVWTKEAVATGSSGAYIDIADIVVDSHDLPGVVWSDNFGNNEIYFSRRAASGWQKANGSPGVDNISNTSTASFTASLGFDHFDRPVVSWQEIITSPSVDERIYLSRWNGLAWTKMDMTTPGANNVTAELGISSGSISRINTSVSDSCGDPSIVWTEGDTLKTEAVYTHWHHPDSRPNTVQSTTVNVSGENISSATLHVLDRLNNGTIDYYLSNNGGASFESVTPGSSHIFSSTGSDLRWKAILSGSANTIACPVLKSLTIDYSTNNAVRVSGDDPIELAVNVNKQVYPNGSAPVVVLGRSDLLIDEFVSTPLVSLTNAGLLLTPPSNLDSRTLTEIQRVLSLSGKIYLLGGAEALTPAVHDALAAAGYTNIERLGGERRYETAIEIYKEIKDLNPDTTSKVFLTEASFLVDSFAIGPAAGDKTDGNVDPILLTRRGENTLYPASQDHLDLVQTELTHLELIGGEEAIPSSIGEFLTRNYGQLTTSRTAGNNRYQTNQFINEKYFPSPSAVMVANGEGPKIPGSISATQATQGSSLFTALLAGSFAAKQSAPLILTQANLLPEPNASYLKDHAGTIDIAYVIGNILDVADTVRDYIGVLI